MEHFKSKQPTLVTAGGKITCRRCQAMSKRTGKQCGAPADRYSKTGKCKWHGGRSTGPNTEQGRRRCAEAKTVHGNSTRKKRTQNAIAATKLLLLRDLGARIGLFGNESTRWPGRRPRDYPVTEPVSLAELIALIEKAESN